VLQAADARAVSVQPEVRELATEDDVLVGSSLTLPVPAGELAGDVDRVRAAGVQDDLRVGDGGDHGEALGEGERLVVGEPCERVVSLQSAHLPSGGFGEARVGVTDVRVPQLRRPVEQAMTVLGVDIRTRTVRDDQLTADHGRHMGLGRPERGGVDHRHSPSRQKRLLVQYQIVVMYALLAAWTFAVALTSQLAERAIFDDAERVALR
jgi:hypothetical protein